MNNRKSSTVRYPVQGKHAPVSGLWDDEWYVIEEDWIGMQLMTTRLGGQYSSEEAAKKAAAKK